MLSITGHLPFLLFGLTTSLHCIGMCGPLSCLFCRSENKKILPLFLYHLGRFFIYSILGLTAARLNIMQYPLMQYSIVIVLVIFALGFFGDYLGTYQKLPTQRIMAVTTRFAKQHRLIGALLFGILTPLLPCGMLYAAVGAASMAESSFLGMSYMACFAIGTMPLMLAGQLGYHQVISTLSPRVRKIIQWLLMLLSLALFLMMRPQ